MWSARPSFSCHSRNHNTIWCYSNLCKYYPFPTVYPRHTSRSVTLSLSLRIIQITLSSAPFFSSTTYIYIFLSFPFLLLIFWKIFSSPFWRPCLFHSSTLLSWTSLTHQICFLISLVSLLVLIIIKIFMTDYKFMSWFQNYPGVIFNLSSDNSPRGCLYSMFPNIFAAHFLFKSIVTRLQISNTIGSIPLKGATSGLFSAQHPSPLTSLGRI